MPQKTKKVILGEIFDTTWEELKKIGICLGELKVIERQQLISCNMTLVFPPGVRTCELFLCFVATVRVRAIVLTSLFSLFYVTGEFYRFLHRGRA